MKTLKLRLAAAAALVLGQVFAASAMTYYVDASRPDNNDDGLSEAKAKRDIFAAINISAAGDLILVKPGTYTSTLSAHLDHALTIRATEGPEKTFIRTESQAIDTFNGTKEPVFDGFTVSSKGDDWSIWGGTYTNCVIAFCRGKIGGAKFFSSTIACNDLALRSDAVTSFDCLLWGNPVVSETEPNPCFLDPENFDFRLRAFSPEAYTNPRLGYYQGPLVEGQIVRASVDGTGKLEGELFNLVAVGGSITLKCAATSPRSVERWLDENGEAIVDGGDYELTADSLTIKNVTADRRITACFERKTWYVNVDTGDDAGKDGLSEGAPFKTIARALASAIDLDTILVAKGTYAEGCDVIDHNKYPKLRVTNGRRLTIRATGARAATIIDGNNETSCLWLNDNLVINTNVVVEGFTIQNGQASWLTGVGAVGGGAFGGLLRNCTIQNCTSGSGNSGDGGGAAYARLENCTVTGCKAHSEGGALSWCDAEACDIRGNSMVGNSTDARGCAVNRGTLVNCLIADNEFESTVMGGRGAVYRSKLYGCTVTDNRNNASSDRGGAGVYGDTSYTTLCNTIVYGNLSDGQPDDLQSVSGADLSTCCTNDPSFKDSASGDYRLKPTSVCHNAGKNSYVIGAYDLAGNARIQEGTVDLGAYEYCPIMTITAEPTQATAGTAYYYTLTQTGGGEPVVWTIDDAVPEGISLSGDQLVGTPVKGGTYSFRVTAREVGGETQSKIVTMDVLSNYTLKFDGNGNKTGTAPDDKSLTSVEEYVLPEPGMACGCARFLGWATNATAAATYQPGDTVKGLCSEPNGIVTLYAAWEDAFVVQFDMNAENVLGRHQSYTNTTGASFFLYRTDGSTNLVDYGSSSHEAPCRIGWTLDCWNTEADGSGAKVCQNGAWSEKVSAATFGASRGDVVTLYAQWQKSTWSFYVPDAQLGEGKWRLELNGDDSAVLGNVSGTVTWPESLTLPAAYRGRTVSSLTYRLQYMSADSQESVRHLVIPEGYTNLCAYAFQNLYALESISFPSTLAAIPDRCCNNCTNLTSIAFAEGNRSVGAAAFSGCSKLPEVEFPRGLTNLASQAFCQCAGLTKVTLSPDYVGSTSTSQQFQHSPIAKLELPASCRGFGWNALEKTAALRFLGDRPTWTVWNANLGYAQLIEYPATNTTWNAGPIASYSSKPHKGFVGPIAAFGVTDAYFWTNANETVTFAYAESPLAETVTLPEDTISWGGVDWEIVGFEPDAFDGQPTTTIYYPILEYAKWEQVTPPEGITLAPAPGTFFTLAFNANGGDPYVPAAMTFPPSGTRTLPSAAPTRSSYKFLGWATTSDGTVAYQPGDGYTAGAAGASATLYAKWEEVGNYTIHFNGNSANATGVPTDIVTVVGTTPAIPPSVPVREGWAFGGWTNAVNDHVYQVDDTFDEDCAANATFTLFAKWTEKSVSNMDFVDGDGSKWTYNRTGDQVTLTKFTPGATVTSYTKPSTINGGTVVNRDAFDPMTVYVGGVWWAYEVDVSSKVHLKGATMVGTTDVVVPSEIAGKTVVELKNSCFKGNAQITSIVLPDTLTVFNYGILGYGCAALTNAVLPSTMTHLPSEFFYQASALRTVVIPAGLTGIDTRAFAGCEALEELELPACCTDVDGEAFSYNTGSVRGFDAGGFRFADADRRILVAFDRHACDELVIPDGTAVICWEALHYLKSRRVVIPEGVVAIGYAGFESSVGLESVELPSTLVSLSSLLFCRTSAEEVSFYASTLPYSGVGDRTCGTTTITNALVRGGAPSWNLKAYFTGLTTVRYDVKREAEWSAYKAAYPALTYCDDLVPYATIAFDANGGDGEMAEMTFVECGMPTNLPACALTRSGCVFAGWALEPEGEVAYGDGAAVDVLPAWCGTVVRLYAKWASAGHDAYTISFRAGAGTGTMDGMVCARGKVYNLAKCAFKAPDGKAFAGWAGDNGKRYDDGILIFNAAEEGKVLTLTAVWE